MWWLVVLVAVVALGAFLEWRSWKKPAVPGLQNHWGSHNAALNADRTLTGGHDTDKRS